MLKLDSNCRINKTINGLILVPILFFENSKNLIGIYSVFFEFEKNQNHSNDEHLEILKKRKL